MGTISILKQYYRKSYLLNNNNLGFISIIMKKQVITILLVFFLSLCMYGNGIANSFKTKHNFTIQYQTTLSSEDTLLEPKDGEIVYTLQPNCKWKSFGDKIYKVGGTNYISDWLVDTTHKYTVLLKYDTEYEWGVGSTFQFELIGVHKRRKFRTCNPIITLYFPEDQLISTLKPISLNWNKIGGEISYNLQIAKDPNFTFGFSVQEYNYIDSIYHTDWLIKNKQYYWRVQAAYGPIGHIWSEVRSILVLDTTLKKVYPDSASSVTDTAITLRWNKLEGTNNYTVKLSSSPQFFTTLVDSSTVLDTFLYVPKLEKNKIYYWTVSSSTDVVNVPSSVWRFTTQTKPQLVEPPNKLADAPKLLTFKWRRQGQLSASSFFQLSNKADFSTLIEDISDILDTTYFYDGTNTLKQNTTYHWRVKQLVGDDTTAWSNIWTFRLPGLPMVTQRYPDSNAIGIPVDTLLHWNPVSDIEGYTVRVSTVPNFTTTVLERTPIMSVLQTDIKNLEHNRRYYWQTRTRKDSEFGEWSDVWDFLTILAKPNLLQPTNDLTIAPRDVNFTWQPVNGAESYDLKVSKDSTFATTVVNESGITANSFEYKSLEKETTYYWQVKSNSSKNLGQWSDVKRFTTNSLTSVHEGENVGIEIIPNPVSNVSKILIHTNSNEQLYSVTVSNILGISVMTFPINNSKEFTLNANGFPQGIYFLEVTTSKKSFVYPFQLLR